MADFQVSVRGGYRDVGGLVLDCSPHDYVAESGRVARWRNRAPQAPLGTSHGRFGDPQLYAPADVTRRPVARSDGALRFVRAEQTVLLLPTEAGDGAADRDWAFAFEYAKGADVSDGQAILGFNNSVAFTIYRLKSGDAVLATSTTSSGFAGDLGDAGRASVVGFRGAPATRFDWGVDAVPKASNQVCAAFGVNAPDALAATVGASNTGEYLDGDLYSLRAWRKPLSPREVDLVYRDCATAGPLNLMQRCAVETRPWRDGTGHPSLRQFDRLRPLPGEPHTFKLARLGPGYVQFGCENDGVTLEDARLGGDLYSPSVVERAGPVGFAGDGGWSSVVDAYVTTPGHYTLQFARPNHGSKVVHFDVVR